jgi:AmmeMemoRadiSam system protein B
VKGDREILTATEIQGMRLPAVAGLFYPAEPGELARMIDGFAQATPPAPATAPKAVIAPHAGYVYSGQAAAQVIARFRPDKDIIRRIVLMGPCHRVAIRGLAAPCVTSFATPLGTIAIDQDAIATVLNRPFVGVSDEAHAEEHSLEVQLPLLQRGLGSFRLVPFAVGAATPDQVAEVIEALWGGPETRFVISSDLSHFLADAEARRRDEATAQKIERLDASNLGPEDACGCLAIAGLLKAASARAMQVERIALLTSADTAGGPDRVVGYGGWALS